MSRAVVLMMVLACGCYDLDGLTRSYASRGNDLSGAGNRDGGAPGSADLSDAGALNADGGWRAVTSPTTQPLRGISGDGIDLFAVGAGSTILRLSSSVSVESAPPGFNLRAVIAAASGTFAVGDSGAVLTRASGSWSSTSLVDATFYGVTLLGDGQPLVVGSAGSVEQHTSTGWLGEDPGVYVELNGAWTQPSGDVIVLGAGGTILQGTAGTPLAWSMQSSPVISDLFAVWGTSSDVWIVGAGGVILHSGNGGAWQPESSGTSSDLFGVAGANGIVWAVGAGGVIVSRRSGAWTLEHTGGADLRAVWAGSSGAFAVGDGGTILRR